MKKIEPISDKELSTAKQSWQGADRSLVSRLIARIEATDDTERELRARIEKVLAIPEGVGSAYGDVGYAQCMRDVRAILAPKVERAAHRVEPFVFVRGEVEWNVVRDDDYIIARFTHNDPDAEQHARDFAGRLNREDSDG